MSKAPTKFIAGLGLRHSRPKPNPDGDLTKHKLSPQEFFLLTQVDGKTSYGQLCAISGLGEEKAAAVLNRLKEFRLIFGEGEPLPPKVDTVPERKRPHTPTPVVNVAASLKKSEDKAAKAPDPKTSPKAPTTDSGKTILQLLDDRSTVDPLLLAEAPDLDDELKMRILRVHKRLEELSPYQLLGLLPGADKKDLKRGYYQASKEFHPDRYYGKDLGPFRQILADIFNHATRGFETLMAMDEKQRRDFDEILVKKMRADARRH